MPERCSPARVRFAALARALACSAPVRATQTCDGRLRREQLRLCTFSGIERSRQQCKKLLTRIGLLMEVLPEERVTSQKQGLTIAEGIHSANSIEESGIEQMRRVGRAISSAVGDGTKMAMILAYALVEGGQSALAQGHALHDVLRGMERGVTAARSLIVGNSQPSTSGDILAVARTASNDPRISNLVLEAVKESGPDGVILVETRAGTECELSLQEGLRFDRGYWTPQKHFEPHSTSRFHTRKKFSRRTLGAWVLSQFAKPAVLRLEALRTSAARTRHSSLHWAFFPGTSPGVVRTSAVPGSHSLR
jgi:hypothetical protein